MHAASEDVTQTLCRRRDMQTVVCRRDMLAKVCGHMVKREQSYDARSYFHQQLFDGRCAHETETMLFKIQSMQIHTIIIQPFISGEEGGGQGGGGVSANSRVHTREVKSETRATADGAPTRGLQWRASRSARIGSCEPMSSAMTTSGPLQAGWRAEARPTKRALARHASPLEAKRGR